MEQALAYLKNIIYNNNESKNLDILILSETFEIFDINAHNIDGYTAFYNQSTINNHDGTIIYIKNALHPDILITKINNFNFIRAIIQKHNMKIGITAIYRLPRYKKKRY